MHFHYPFTQAARSGIGLGAMLVVLLAGCGGGGSTASTPTPTISPYQMGGAIQRAPLNLAPTVSILAGTVRGADGTGVAARFYLPNGITSDGVNLYVADTSNHKIRKIEIATGVVTTLAGTAAEFGDPNSIATDGANLYVTDGVYNKICQIVIATGVVTTLAGTGEAGAADGAGTTATFDSPSGIATDGANLYVTERDNNKIRKIVIATGVVSSLTGTANTAGTAGAADGAGAVATFNWPIGITSDGSNLYVADMFNNKIRKIVIATGEVSSLTGVANTAGMSGAADGSGAAARFDWPMGITNDGINLYVVDTSNNKIRKIVIATGVVSSVTGAANMKAAGGAVDGAGASAAFDLPYGITASGNKLYVADTYNNTIRSVALANAAVTTLAGRVDGADGMGAAATFSYPGGITSDGGNLYVADTYANKVRKIVIATGAVTTLAGTGAAGAADGEGGAATFGSLDCGITTDGNNLYLVDSGNNKIRKIVIATGVVSSLTGVANMTSAVGAADGAGVAATFDINSGLTSSGITTDGSNLYVADTNNHKIRRIVIATGVVSSLTGVANMASATGAVDGSGTTASFNFPGGITTDGSSLYVADSYNHKIRKIVIATGAVSSVTGGENTASVVGATDGAGLTAKFVLPLGITSDGTNLYVVDSAINKIRKIEIATGVVSSVTGVANLSGVAGAADGAGTAAAFSYPQDITTDGSSLFVTDTSNNTIRKIQ